MSRIFRTCLAVGSTILLLNLAALWSPGLDHNGWSILLGFALVIVGSAGKERE